MCSQGGLLDSRSDRCGHIIFLFQQSSVLTVSSLKLSKRSKAQFTQSNKSQLFSAQGPIYLLPQTLALRSTNANDHSASF